MQIITFVLAGGSGTRLAPLSLTSPGKLPKQFLSLVGNKTMLQETVERIPAGSKVVIIPEEKFETVVKQQAPQAEIIAEPFGCNTAPAIGLAARWALAKTNNPDCILFFMPADHMMDKTAFQKTFNAATLAADQTGKIITIGITPSRPETGYGYIKVKSTDGSTLPVERFVEKPDLQTAQQYLKEGGYYWNAGIFAIKISTILAALKKDAPVIAEHIEKIDLNQNLSTEIAREYQALKNIKQNISIDYAVMEKEAANMLLIPADKNLGWNDVGGWIALAEYVKPDQHNNLILNYLKAKIEIKNCRDLVVVTSGNGILITTQNLAQRAKEIIPGIEAKKTIELIDCKNTTINNSTNIYIGVIGLNNTNISYTDNLLIIQ